MYKTNAGLYNRRESIFYIRARGCAHIFCMIFKFDVVSFRDQGFFPTE